MEDWRDKNFKETNDDDSLPGSDLEGHRRIIPKRTWDEEFSADMTYDDVKKDTLDDDLVDNNEQSFQITGWIAVALSIISFFIMPIIMAAAGIILGVISRSKRARTLGNTAIIISIISLAYFLFVRPMIF